jgi:chromosome segregation ATPase
MASIIDTDRFRGREAASQGTGGDGGGTVDDTQRRLGNLESMVQQISGDVREIKAVMSHLATKAELGEQGTETKAELGELRADIHAIKAELPHLATKEALKEVEGSLKADIKAAEGSLRADILALKADMHARDTRNLTWLIGTMIAVATLTFSIAKFVN